MIARIVPPGPVTLAAILDKAAAEVGMPLRVVPAIKRGTDLSGLTMVATSSKGRIGVIFVPADARSEYRLHVVGHELWHLISGHRCSAEQTTSSETGLRGLWAVWRSCWREAMCDRFAARLGLAVQMREHQHRRQQTLPPAALILDDALGLTPVG